MCSCLSTRHSIKAEVHSTCHRLSTSDFSIAKRTPLLRPTMRAYLVLLLLLPLCTADYNIECYGEDFLMLRNQLLQCSSKTQQACYIRSSGEKGCARLEFCSRPGWTCCYQDRCNA
uniref:Wu:fj16a03 n=1 Tax=Salmo trutta TaxID=8032 RepID=A0A673Y3H6_SALTR